MPKTVIPYLHHGLKRAVFSAHACHIIATLQCAGYEAYIVGGGVRDLLLGLHPKDFDVTTNATPEEIKHLFPNCILIGKRFRLAHIYFKNEMIEVATFRTSHEEATKTASAKTYEGIITRDNVYGNLEQDASRRDFTVNALYYNPQNETIIDFSGGWQDINAHVLRLIGIPSQRYQEDPVRILRAIRFSTKLNFVIE
jgi:poly(A) polymerase